MPNRSRRGTTGSRLLRVSLFFLASLAVPRGAEAQEPCAAFVHLEDGRFMEGNTPYAMEGPNFPMGVAGIEAHPGADPAWEYFLAPYDTFRPDGLAVCNGTSTLSCCYSEATCLGDLHYDVDALVAMGANSVRMIPPRMEWHTTDPTHHTPYFQCMTASVPGANNHRCEMDLMDSYQRERALDLFEAEINTLGDKGIRTILVTGRPDAGNQYGALEYGRWLEDLAARLANNPYLIAYDPMNEPLYGFDASVSGYACEPGELAGSCKSIAIAASKSWFDHLTLKDPNHLVTIGLGGTGSVLMWDPAILWDHFTSYHIYSYPGGTWDDPGPGSPIDEPNFPAAAPVSGGRGIENDIYYGSLNGCGVRCPFVGEDDSRNCYVGAGALGSVGFLDDGGFDYPHFPTGAPCPVGTDTGTECQVATYDPGRDEPFIMTQPLYYVISQPGVACPPGTTSDTSNCLAFVGPPGAQPFIWTSPAGDTGFYYSYLSPGHHCDAPAVDDTANCYLGPVPDDWTPFYLTRPLYYVKPVSCGTRKPIYFGETGFSTHPYPTGSPDFWDSPPSGLPTRLNELHAQCDRVEGGPLIDTVTVGGELLEAENGIVTMAAMIESSPGASKGKAVRMLAGQQLDVHPSGTGEGCSEITIDYRSDRETRVWLTMAGRAPLRIVLPGTSNLWASTPIPLSLPAGTDTITVTVPHDSANGDSVQQAEYFTGDGGSWPGLFPYSQACGFQGLHYWIYGSLTRWGGCGDTALNAPWYEVSLTSPPSTPALAQRELRLTAAAETLRDQVDFLAPWSGKCAEPPSFRVPTSREIGPSPSHVYHGKVTTDDGTPLANVPVWAWFDDCDQWRGGLSTYTDRNGDYEIVSGVPLHDGVLSSHFGYRTAEVWGFIGPNTFATLKLTPIASAAPVPPPTPPTLACRGADGWVPQ